LAERVDLRFMALDVALRHARAHWTAEAEMETNPQISPRTSLDHPNLLWQE
jgi:hypothetical protein